MPSAGGSYPAGGVGSGDLWAPRGALVHLRLLQGSGPIGLAIYHRYD